MKFNDKLKIAITHIKDNKASTFLTIVIVSILSFLVMGVAIIGVLFKESMVKTYRDFTVSNDISIHVFTQTVLEDDSIESIQNITKETINKYDYSILILDDKRTIYILYEPSLKDDSDEIINNFEKLYKEIKTIVPTLKTPFGTVQDVNCETIDSLNRAKAISTILLLLIIFSGLITLISTIGTIINSILISIDQNKSSFGVLKALGITDKDTFEIVIMEIFITIVSGVLLSSLLLLLLNKIVVLLSMHLVNMTIHIAMDGFHGGIVSPNNIPFYIPIATILLMIIFIIIFARTNLYKTINASPLEIISEANHHEN